MGKWGCQARRLSVEFLWTQDTKKSQHRRLSVEIFCTLTTQKRQARRLSVEINVH